MWRAILAAAAAAVLLACSNGDDDTSADPPDETTTTAVDEPTPYSVSLETIDGTRRGWAIDCTDGRTLNYLEPTDPDAPFEVSGWGYVGEAWQTFDDGYTEARQDCVT